MFRRMTLNTEEIIKDYKMALETFHYDSEECFRYLCGIAFGNNRCSVAEQNNVLKELIVAVEGQDAYTGSKQEYDKAKESYLDCSFVYGTPEPTALELDQEANASLKFNVSKRGYEDLARYGSLSPKTENLVVEMQAYYQNKTAEETTASDVILDVEQEMV